MSTTNCFIIVALVLAAVLYIVAWITRPDLALEVSYEDKDGGTADDDDIWFHFYPRSNRGRAWYATYHPLKHPNCSCLDGMITVDSKRVGPILKDIAAAGLKLNVEKDG